MPSIYSQSEDYKRFRNWIAQRKSPLTLIASAGRIYKALVLYPQTSADTLVAW